MRFEDMVLGRVLIETLKEDRERLIHRILDLLEGVGDPLTLQEQARIRKFCRAIEVEIGTDNAAYREITAALDALDRPTARLLRCSGG